MTGWTIVEKYGSYGNYMKLNLSWPEVEMQSIWVDKFQANCKKDEFQSFILVERICNKITDVHLKRWLTFLAVFWVMEFSKYKLINFSIFLMIKLSPHLTYTQLAGEHTLAWWERAHLRCSELNQRTWKWVELFSFVVVVEDLLLWQVKVDLEL